mgnify:CR=1 FL=1
MLVIFCRCLSMQGCLRRSQVYEVTSDNARVIGVCLLLTSGEVMSSAHDW